jgi:hypothetical protein
MVRPTRWISGLLLVAALTWIPAASAEAQSRYWRSGFVFSYEPRMNFVPNTSVYYDRRASGYDMYRYGNRWYLVDQGSWYTANDWRGPFISVSFDALPDEVATLPDSYRHYWNSSDGVIRTDIPEGSWVSPRNFVRKPKMYNVGRGVQYARNSDDFDLYRFRSTWFLVEDGHWFQSDSWRGPFFSIRASRAPHEVLTVSTAYRRHWMTDYRYGYSRNDYGRNYDRDDAYRSSNRTYDRFWQSGTTLDVQPDMRIIPSTNVYYVRDASGYEMYRYANTWYLMDNGQWYSANTWRGPFAVITVNGVPREITTIPYAYRHYWTRTED